MKWPIPSRGLVYRLLRLVALALIVAVWWRTGRMEQWSADFLFFCLAAGAWFVLTFLLDWGTRGYQWSAGLAHLLLVSMDAYFIVMCLGLAAGTATLAVRILGVYCFIVVFVSRPLASVCAAASGVLAYASMYWLSAHPHSVGLPVAAAAGAAGLVCGTAWKVCAPFLWRVIRAVAGGVDTARAASVPAAENPAATPSASAPPKADQPAAPPPAPTADARGQEWEAARRQAEELHITLAAREAALAERAQACDALQRQVEDLQKQVTERDAAPPPDTSAQEALQQRVQELEQQVSDRDDRLRAFENMQDAEELQRWVLDLQKTVNDREAEIKRQHEELEAFRRQLQERDGVSDLASVGADAVRPLLLLEEEEGDALTDDAGTRAAPLLMGAPEAAAGAAGAARPAGASPETQQEIERLKRWVQDLQQSLADKDALLKGFENAKGADGLQRWVQDLQKKLTERDTALRETERAREALAREKEELTKKNAALAGDLEVANKELMAAYKV